MTTHRKPFAERLRAGLDEALAHTRGELTLKTIEHLEAPPEIDSDTLTALRIEAAMSQAVFAKMLSASTKTVQSWEQGTRTPSMPARRLIQLFIAEPEVVCRIVGLPGVKVKGFSVKRLTQSRRRIVREKV